VGPKRFISHVFLNMFGVPKPGESAVRVVVDFKPLNNRITCPKFRLGDLRVILPLIRPNIFMCVIDLNKAFWNLYLKPGFLDIVVNFRGTWFKWVGACQGWNIVPFAFTKLTKPILAHCGSVHRMNVTILYKDIRTGAPTERLCQEHGLIMIQMLQLLRLALNLKKTCIKPSEVVDHQGHTLNLIDMTISLTKNRLLSVKKLLSSAVQKSLVSPRFIARVAGSFGAGGRAVNQHQARAIETRFFLADAQRSLKVFLHKKEWDSFFPLQWLYVRNGIVGYAMLCGTMANRSTSHGRIFFGRLMPPTRVVLA